MQKNWSEFWNELLEMNKLRNTIEELNIVSPDNNIEDICHSIYNQYDEYSKELEIIRDKLVKEVERFPGVHLQTSRVKTIDSLLLKIIKKKHQRMMDQTDRYSSLSDQNYKTILTDLSGIRLILSYRGSWKTLHSAILDRFPLKDEAEYSNDRLIPLSENGNFIAEKPHAYYAEGDDISIYDGEFVHPILRESGYRCVHYILCFFGHYVEIQTRTIYDEAWCDCDHSFVYKKESHRCHSALKILSAILCTYTNTSNNLGDLMKEIYDRCLITEKNDLYISSSEETIKQIDKLITNFSSAQNELMQFRKRLTAKKEGDVNDE